MVNTDRPIRPLFPEDYKNEVQIIAQVISLNPEVDGDIPALIGASAALALAGTPFMGPIGAARVGFVDGAYVLNPATDDMEKLRDNPEQRLDLVVAGTKDAVMMVESEAYELSEAEMLGAVKFGHEQMQPVIDLIIDLAEVAADVAARTGMSRVTAWRYLERLADDGTVTRRSEYGGTGRPKTRYLWR